MSSVPLFKQTPASVAQACDKAVGWIDSIIQQINKMQLQDNSTRNMLVAQLGLLRRQLDAHDKKALERTAALSVAIPLLHDLSTKIASLKTAEASLPHVRGSPENIKLIRAHVTSALDAAKRIEISISNFVAGKTTEPLEIEGNARLFDTGAGISVKLLGIALAFQDSAKKMKENGKKAFEETEAAVAGHYNNKRERDEKLECIHEQRGAFNRAHARLEQYKLTELVEISKNGDVSVRHDSAPMQFLNRPSVLRSYHVAWQELARKLAGDKKSCNPAQLQFLAEVAKQQVLAQIRMLRNETTVRMTDENGRPLLDAHGKPRMRNLLPKEVIRKLVEEQLYRVHGHLEFAERTLKSAVSGSGPGMSEYYLNGATKALADAALADYDARAEIAKVAGKYLQVYLRKEEDKIGAGPDRTKLQKIGYWLRSSGERYNDHVADALVIGLGVIGMFTPFAPYVLVAETAYWTMRGTQYVYGAYLATGEINAGALATGAAMSLPGISALSLRFVTRTAAKTAIEFTATGASAFLVGSGVYEIVDAIKESRAYGLTSADIEAIASGTIMLGLGLKGRWLAKKFVPARVAPVEIVQPTQIEKAGRTEETGRLEPTPMETSDRILRKAERPVPQEPKPVLIKESGTRLAPARERPAVSEEARVTEQDLTFARNYLESEGVNAELAGRVIAMLSGQPKLLLDKGHFLDNIITAFCHLPSETAEHILRLSPSLQLYLLRDKKAVDNVIVILDKIRFLDEARRNPQVAKNPELDYLSNPRVLEREITDFTRIISRVGQEETASMVRLRKDRLRFADRVDRMLHDTASKELAAIFNREIGGILDAFARHGSEPLATFRYPGVNYKFKNVFGIDLSSGARAIFYISEGRIYVIYVGDHIGADKLLDRLRPSRKSLEDTYPQAGFKAA